MSLENKPDLSENHDFTYRANVPNIIDGDTIAVELDLGFGITRKIRVRLRDIDTKETHFVDHNSAEYQRGVQHRNGLITWIAEAQHASDSTEEWPFTFYSHEYETGTYGRVIGDLWSDFHEEWASRHIFEKFDDVELYEE